MYDPKKRMSKYVFIAFFVILGYLAYLLAKPFFGAVIIGLIVAYALMPLHRRLSGFFKNKNISAGLITICLIVIALLLFLLIVSLLVNESATIYDKINVSGLVSLIQKYVDSEKVEQYINIVAQKGLGAFLDLVSRLVVSLPEKIIMILISLATIFFALRDSEKLTAGIRNVMPVSEEYKGKITARFGHTVDAVLYSMVLVSILQGIVATIGYYLFGVSTPLLWGFVTLVIAMLPFVGPTLVWAPLAVYLFATGHTAAAIGLAVFCLLFVTILLDMVLKPKLISQKGKIHPLIAIIGVIGGFSVFGVSGVILGPFVLSLFIFLLTVLLGKEHIKLQE
ncbi:MAG TPA: AI-2E family transporter [Nanoarchaeota archaeon]|nr:AI-2E family transporter [Nanoarchaeota archaeon]